ncbi:HRDC domain-containing protein [Blastococcus sp. TF02-8]|uniref:HRDC domain-containing protein n=1 Tax=Blastococcus sp. TF02-8 TaxID=2250574 RepID=UPI001F0BB94C|nr:HRDC domain-containing protein [Blastococcus sp. TF02-8]
MPLLAPRDGLPPVIETSTQLVEYAEALRGGTGPVAVDAERASGYRYGQKAYLVQLRRQGAGTGLLDPIPLPDLSVLQDAIADAEWVLHAASQDLPCLAEIGLVPSRIFDTELAARLAGLPRVGLGAVVESLLGYSLVKGHSAADWSTRPLPEEWLVYAALDVEVLVDLRDALAAILEEQGKTEWARQEFEAILAAGPPAPKQDPWRRTSGLQGLGRRQLAMLRAIWEARDELARKRDIAPGRVLPDAAMVAAVQADPKNEGALLELPVFRGRANRRLVRHWFDALARGKAVPEDQLPLRSRPGDGPPAANRWADRDPAAATRLQVARAGLAELKAKYDDMPVENILSPDLVRRIMWSPPEPRDRAGVEAALRAGGAREWQIELTADLLTDAANRA